VPVFKGYSFIHMVTSDVYKNTSHHIAQMSAESGDEKQSCLFWDTTQDKYISGLDTMF